MRSLENLKPHPETREMTGSRIVIGQSLDSTSIQTSI